MKILNCILVEEQTVLLLLYFPFSFIALCKNSECWSLVLWTEISWSRKFNDSHVLQHVNELVLLFKGCAATGKYVVVQSATNTTTTSKNNDATSTTETKHQFGLNEEEVGVGSVTPENTKRQSKF